MHRSLALLLAALPLWAACRAKETPPDPTVLLADLQSADPEKRGRANLELIRMGEPAVPGLVELLKSGDPRVRSQVAATFWGMGGRARAAVPALAEALGDPDPVFRASVAMALENMGPAAAGAVPALIKGLSDSDRAVRQAAVRALGAIGPEAQAAIPVLNRLLKRGSWPEAEEAIVRIRGVAEVPSATP